MNPKRLFKSGLLAAAALLLVLLAQFQHALNQQRHDPKLGLVRFAGLGSNAPPVLAFTTVALGGFRGLIANALWVRANDLQNDGKYFEMVQLADWITKLQPTFTQVWVVQAWNMAYNISVKFSAPADRWRWVQRGIELLRDDALRFSPNEALIYRELAWFFQHKMGQNMDDAHLFYKQEWARKMDALLGGGRPPFQALLHPQTEADRQRLKTLQETYKLDPQLMQEVDQQFGPLEWRLPDAHAIYWACAGLKTSKPKDLITLRRVIYQSMHQIVLRGRLRSVDPLRYGPDLDKIEKANAAYEQMISQDAEMRDAIQRAHGSFLRESIYMLYSYNRLAEANTWLAYARTHYPQTIPPNQTLDEFALDRLKANIADMSQDRTKLVLTGLIHQHFLSLALDEDGRAEAFDRMARHLWKYWDERSALRGNVLKFPPLDEMKRAVLQEMVDPANELLVPDLIARLRTRLGLAAPASAPSAQPTSRP